MFSHYKIYHNRNTHSKIRYNNISPKALDIFRYLKINNAIIGHVMFKIQIYLSWLQI